jgi:hypothetical protein
MPHIQIRTSLGHASALNDGSGAMSEVPTEIDPLILNRGALADLLTLLADNEFDLGMASGDSIEGGGEFIFALKDDDEGLVGACASLLRDRGYRNVRIVEPQHFELDDTRGALAAAIRGLSDAGKQIDEVFVGITLTNGKVPVQVTTIQAEEESAG